MRSSAGKPHGPRGSAPLQYLQQSLLVTLTPRLMGKSSASPLLAAGKFLLVGCWVPQAMGSLSAGLSARRLGSSSAWGEEGQQSCAYLCRQSQLQLEPSREVPLLEEGL